MISVAGAKEIFKLSMLDVFADKIACLQSSYCPVMIQSDFLQSMNMSWKPGSYWIRVLILATTKHVAWSYLNGKNPLCSRITGSSVEK